MNRSEASAVLRDVANTRCRTDVPADVVEAIRVAMEVLGDMVANVTALTGDDPVEAVEVAERIRAERAGALARWAAQQ